MAPRKKAKPLTKKQSMSLSEIPIPKFLKKRHKTISKKKNRKKDKHQDAFVAYAKWMATPTRNREPATKVAFQKLWKLPHDYMRKWEDDEEWLGLFDRFFWRWLSSHLPDIADASLQRAMSKTRGSTQDAKLLIDLIGKRLDVNKPPARVQPFFLVGVDQGKIEELFTPPEIVEAAEVTLDRERKRKGFTSMDEAPPELRVESI